MRFLTTMAKRDPLHRPSDQHEVYFELTEEKVRYVQESEVSGERLTLMETLPIVMNHGAFPAKVKGILMESATTSAVLKLSVF